MYYKITNTELEENLKALCASKDSAKYGNNILKENLNQYCKNNDYEKICTYSINNNIITDNHNDYMYTQNNCLKIKPFIEKIPYTITK